MAESQVGESATDVVAAAARVQTALDLFAMGVEMLRMRLRRENPAWSAEELDLRIDHYVYIGESSKGCTGLTSPTLLREAKCLIKKRCHSAAPAILVIVCASTAHPKAHYNRHRRHSKLCYASPMQYEADYHQRRSAALPNT